MEHALDVIVVGGGPAGIGAAVAAARMGARVALVERYPMLGGMGTAALVNNFCPAHFDGQRFIIGGIFAELRRRLIDRRAIYTLKPLETANPIIEPYDPDVFTEETAAVCRAAGVALRLGRRLDLGQVETGAGGLGALRLDDGATVQARVVVDATGDAAVAAAAGVPYTAGDARTGAVMPLTYCYRIGPIDLDAAARDFPQAVLFDETVGERYFYFSGWDPVVDAWVKEDREKGDLRIPRDHISAILSVPGRPEHATVNFGRVTVADPTDPAQLAAAEEEGRRQVEDGIRFFRRRLPGLANVALVQLARQIGVRESRQAAGLYTLTGDDVLGCRQFDDAIAQCCYPIDIHEPGKITTLMKRLPRGRHYDIPWRCLIPQAGPANLIVAGRCISATSEAMSSFRVSPSVMAIGEAAGVTAALAARGDGAVRAVDPQAVRARLRETGGILD